jgi:hypothetical protein
MKSDEDKVYYTEAEGDRQKRHARRRLCTLTCGQPTPQPTRAPCYD